MSGRYQSKPTYSQVAKWRREKKSPLGPIWFDEEGRTYGKRSDPAFDSEYHGSEEAWWINLPTQKIDHPKVTDLIDFPRPGSTIRLTKHGDDDNETEELRLEIINYPEVIKRGQKTASVNVEIA